MLSRSRSIFHIEQEGKKDSDTSNGVFAAVTDGLVGLQILVKHRGIDSKVLIKSSVMKKDKPAKHSSADFLKYCFSCSKELSLQKEVYMYRGDQGFCSAECRYKQILQDERKEADSTRRLRFMREPNNQPNRSKIQVSNNERSKITVAA
ncbi:FCS-Like Zinc finger 17-like [Dendrobium catenatum]|uniref:FCS-Like Zinc finger 17-like n=1 Tax=Dendrobium catenatum TaxID=906689 RepID=UPI0009F2FAB6|nr:FCS-Like Zinc finger 17-like [Dendrobium catenatum]